MTGSVLHIVSPKDFDLARDVCSYGYFVLMPNYWDVTIDRHSAECLEFAEKPAACVIDQLNDGKAAGSV